MNWVCQKEPALLSTSPNLPKRKELMIGLLFPGGFRIPSESDLSLLPRYRHVSGRPPISMAAGVCSLAWINAHANIADAFTKLLSEEVRDKLFGSWLY